MSVRFDRRLASTAVLIMCGGLLAALQGVSAAAPAPSKAKAAIAVGPQVAATNARPSNGQGAPAVAWNGSRYFVVWAEGSLDGPSQIYGTRVSPTGVVLDPNGILLGSSDFDLLSNPTVAGGAGKFFVVWEDEPEGTYDDLAAALVTNSGVVQKQWGLSRVDNQQSNPVAAWNGQLFLTAWEDQPDVVEQDIYGARVTRDGLTLDGCSSDSCPNGDDPGIPISTAPGDQTLPAVAANDEYFVVPWTDADTTTTTDINDAGVAINGDVLAFGFTFTISDAVQAQSQPSIARNGDTFLLAWSDRRSGQNLDIYSTLIAPGSESDFNSTPLSPDGVAVSTANANQSAPAVARRGNGYVVAWMDTRNGGQDVFAARVNASGDLVDASGVPISASPQAESSPSVVAGSGNQVVAYTRVVARAPFNGATRVFFRVLS